MEALRGIYAPDATEVSTVQMQIWQGHVASAIADPKYGFILRRVFDKVTSRQVKNSLLEGMNDILRERLVASGRKFTEADIQRIARVMIYRRTPPQEV